LEVSNSVASRLFATKRFVMEQLRVGVIGFGYMGKLHARAYESLPITRLVAVADANEANLSDLPPSLHGYVDYRHLLNTDLEAVSICLPTHLHYEATLEALEHGKHVLIEKPIAVTFEEASRMITTARSAGRTLFVGMTHRFYPELREAKRLIDEGAIGRIVACNDSILEHVGFLQMPGWHHDKKLGGGGMALSSGIHLVDRLRWFTGDEVTLVCDVRVIGTEGGLTVHTWEGYTLNNAQGTVRKVFYTNEPHPEKVLVGLVGEVEELYSSIRNNRPPNPTPEESARALEIVLAYYRAAETGKLVAV
jgi:predicted dehydrogenase